MEKRHLAKHDFSGFVYGFGFVSLIFIGLSAYQASLGHGGPAFGLALVAAILLTAVLYVRFALMERRPARRLRVAAPDPAQAERVRLARAVVWKDSILNPDHPINQDRIKNPPTIG